MPPAPYKSLFIISYRYNGRNLLQNYEHNPSKCFRHFHQNSPHFVENVLLDIYPCLWYNIITERKGDTPDERVENYDQKGT